MMKLYQLFILSIVFTLLSCKVMADETSKIYKIGQITFLGNVSYEDSRLEGLMLTQSSRFLNLHRFYPEIFQDDLETLIAFYQQNGFLQIRLVDTLISIDSLKNSVNIAITLDEGNRTFIEGVTIFGNYFFADSVLMDKVKIKTGDPLRRPVIEDIVVIFLSLYAENGFLEASVIPKVKVNDSAQLALVDFSLHEGERSLVGNIKIIGAEKTNSNVILRELNFRKGDTVKYSSLISSQQRLYLTGLFESVYIRPVPPSAGNAIEREILIEVKEKPSGELSFSIGYGTVEKVRGRAGLSNTNLAGTARKVGIGIEANLIKQGASISFSEPMTLKTRWKTDISVFGQLLQEPSYHAEILGSNLILGRKLGLRTTASISYRMENTNLTRIDLTVPVIDKDPKIRSFTLTISYDNRDNLFNPSVGSYVNWSNEIAGSFLHGTNTFTKSLITVKRFHPYGRNTVLGSSLEMGWMETYGSSEQIPVNERFYTGGPTSLRGFGYQKVGPLDVNGEPLGGQFKIVWNLLELRRSLYRMIGGVLFFEFGNVWSKPQDVHFSDLRMNIGTGLRGNSPLGILRLDSSINFDRRVNESKIKIIFSMGQAF